jgi:hypothetical protein
MLGTELDVLAILIAPSRMTGRRTPQITDTGDLLRAVFVAEV